MIAWVKWRENIMSYVPKSYLACTRRCHQTRSSVVFDENQKNYRAFTNVNHRPHLEDKICLCMSVTIVGNHVDPSNSSSIILLAPIVSIVTLHSRWHRGCCILTKRASSKIASLTEMDYEWGCEEYCQCFACHFGYRKCGVKEYKSSRGSQHDAEERSWQLTQHIQNEAASKIGRVPRNMHLKKLVFYLFMLFISLPFCFDCFSGRNEWK